MDVTKPYKFKGLGEGGSGGSSGQPCDKAPHVEVPANSRQAGPDPFAGVEVGEETLEADVGWETSANESKSGSTLLGPSARVRSRKLSG